MRYGYWEPLETRLVLDMVESGQTVVDVGANIGYYIVIMSRLVGPQGRVVAFEPEHANLARCRADQVGIRITMGILPKQVEGLELTPVEDGATIHEPTTDRVHYLNPTAALVLELCDGNSDAAEIARLLQDHFKLTAPPQSEVEALLSQFLDEGLVHDAGAESA